MKLDEIKAIYREALQKEDYEKISEVVGILNRASLSFKKESLDFYREIENDLFQKHRSFGNLDARRFYQSIKDSEKTESSSELAQPKADSEKSGDSFEQQFIKFYNRHRQIFCGLPNYHLFKLSDLEFTERPKVLILCDDSTFHDPQLKEIEQSENVLETVRQNISNFVKGLSTPGKQGNAYICILSVTPNLKGISEFEDDLRKLFKTFEDTPCLRIKKKGTNINVGDYVEERNGEKIIDLLRESSNKIFNDKQLSEDFRRTIKTFFKDKTAIIDYKIRDRGSSGSSVIEVQAIFSHMAPSRRFVIKISEKGNDRPSKLETEIRNFNRYVKDVPTEGTAYAADYEVNEAVEAIRYNYASSGSVIDALSFAEILKDFLSSGSITGEYVESVIHSLFNCGLLKSWEHQPNDRVAMVETLYKGHLKKEDRIIAAIDEITLTGEYGKNLIFAYNKIKQINLKTFVKVCHGDLHSDNFFFDGRAVTLIDFGLTGEHHAVIDHTSLESSIRFKHFPRYIPLEELISYDEKFLSLESFKPDFDLSFVKRDKLRELYRLINLIRADSMKHLRDKGSVKEYLVSLFMITFRQIQYADLDQLYALKVAELLANKLK